MHETSLETVQRLIHEGRTTEEIRDALRQADEAGTPATPTPAVPAPAPTAAPSPAPTPNPAPVPAPLLPAADAAPGSAPASLQAAPRLHLPPLGWAVVGLICLIPAIALLITGQVSGGWAQALLALGDITGLVGLAAYVLNLVLATRLSWIEDLFGGLNQAIIAHQILGGLALIALLMHPVFTAVSYYPYGIKTVAHFFIPQLAYIGSAFGIFALILMIVLVILSYYIKLGYKTWLSTHKYLGLAYALIILHVLYTPNRVTGHSFLRTYIYGLLVVGAAAYIYRTLLPNIFVRRFLYTVARAEPKGVGVMELTLTPVGRQIRFRAGQFIFLAFQGDALSDEWHPFSISSSEASGSLMVDIKSLGAYTETLTRLLPDMVGMTVRVEGAYGRFSYRNVPNPNQVWIAGGIGVTPFLSMAQTLGPEPYNIDLYYSVKTASELIDLETLAAHQTNTPGHTFRTIPFITDTYKGHLNVDVLAKNSGDLTQREYLLCGPPVMMQAIKQQLIGLGVKKGQIHSEEFSLD